MKSAVLQITSWQGISLGAEHYYGHLCYYTSDDEFEKYELEKVMTKKDADRLNEKEGDLFCKSGFYKAGRTTNRFDTPEEVRKVGIPKAQELIPDIEIIFEGLWGDGSVMKVIWSKDPQIMKKINELYDMAEKLDFWDHPENDPKMEKLDKKFNKIIGREP